MTSSRARRERFADKVVQFLEQYSLDGVDIDWEWPYSAGAGDNYYQAADSDNLRRFVKRLRQKLGDDKLITLALPNWGLKGSDGQTIQDNSELAGYVDHIMLMNYDQSGVSTPFSTAHWRLIVHPRSLGHRRLDPTRRCTNAGTRRQAPSLPSHSGSALACLHASSLLCVVAA